VRVTELGNISNDCFWPFEMAKPEVAVIFIRNTDGDFFVHRRLPTKKTFPNKYGLGAGGYVDEGETPRLAAQRELLEETGLETPVRYVCTLEFDDPDFQQISHLYVAESEGPIHNDEQEWQWSGWMSKAEVDDLLRENKLCTDTAALYERYVSELENVQK
jgi:8-oxo-dGTP pyrophosphatase MutT (NUDIX family)